MSFKNCKYLLLFVPLLAGLVILSIPYNSFAVTGNCVNCHTMHNSQDGSAMNFNGDTSPNELLLRGADCLGCHRGSDPITETTSGVNVPCVYVDTSPAADEMLAGGNFYYTDLADTPYNDSLGHNCEVLPTNNGDLMFATRGDVPGFTGSWDLGDNPLTCAGSYGCHGLPTTKATGTYDLWSGIKGAHHTNESGARTNAGEIATVGGGYRFLPGIAGLECTNWQNPLTLTETYHNEYKGSTSGIDTTTISAFCARCHGNFHSNLDDKIREGNRPTTPSASGSPWLRHPTDISLPDGEYQSYNNNGGYNLEAPVGRVSIDGTSRNTVDPSDSDSDIVTCISCHRAHGTANPDLLRWCYDYMTAGSTEHDGEGCFVCHTGKDG